MRPSAGTTVVPGQRIWAAVPPGRRAAAVALLAVLAVRAAAAVTGGGHGERGRAPGGAAAAEDPAGAPGAGGDRVRAAVDPGPGARAHRVDAAAVRAGRAGGGAGLGAVPGHRDR